MSVVEAGERHEGGKLTAGVSIDTVRRPKWKEVYTRDCGADAAARVIGETKPTEHRSLVIIERGTARR